MSELKRNLILLAALGNVLSALNVKPEDVLSPEMFAEISAYVDSLPDEASSEENAETIELASQMFRELSGRVLAEAKNPQGVAQTVREE